MNKKYPIIAFLGVFLLICGCIGSNVAPSTASNQIISPTDSGSTTNPTENQNNITTQVLTPPPTSSIATCPPESCTNLDWKTRARQLNIPNYRKEISSEGKLILHSGRLQVVLPDNSNSSEEFGRIELYGLLRAYNHTENLLGRAPFAEPNIIKEEFVLNFRNTGECCGSEEEDYALYWNAGTYDEYLQMINLESPNTQYLQRANWSQIFNGNHELTHRFVWTLRLYSFLDEGLANYAQDHGDRQPMVCGQGGYEQGGQVIPYTYLCYNSMGRIYNSGDCFWQRIEEKYGQEMVRRIITRIYNKEEREERQTYYTSSGTPFARWSSFSGQILIDLEQAFVPEIGDRFWTDFSDFGFSPTMAQGQTYESELIRANCQ
ncbi:hypothetical protein HY990_06265 [Candidatus Micrarchaeota archaeon]|nr:hypothetical protein [Candidatus Micrarchaeota archaeon]